jgi:UDP-glucose 4-epimerase
MASTVLVTGGLGFIGSHVVRALLRAGTPVVVIDRIAEGNAADEVLTPEERAVAPLVASGIPGASALASLLRECTVDAVVHLASPLSVATEPEPRLVVEDMIDPHLALLEAAREAGIRRVVWASSVGVFGRASDYPVTPIPNDAAHLPLTLYGAAKSLMERLSARYSAIHGLDTIGLRFPLVYGPGRRRGGQFTTRLIEGAAIGEPCVAEAIDARFDWMYVADAARSVELALAAGTTAARALTVTGEVATVRDVVDLLRGWFPASEIALEPGSSELVADYDPAPARAQIGYAPAISLRDGVLATANAARRRAGLPAVA